MPQLPPLTLDLALPRDRYLALRWLAAQSGKSMQALVREQLAEWLGRLPDPPGENWAADDD